MDIVHPDIDRYIRDRLRRPHAVFHEMERYAADSNFPIIGPIVGQLLMQLAVAIQAKRVLELGSGFGYSALWFAYGVVDGGEIVCTERSADNVERMRDYFRRVGRERMLSVHQGEALEAVDTLSGPFDIILMDIDKKQYSDGFMAAWPLLRPGGLFIVDNMLWHGRVLEAHPDDTTRAIREFTSTLFGRQDAVTSILPVRDGISISVKRG